MARGRPQQFDREAVLEAALQVFWGRGFGSASLDDVMQAGGIGRQSLYNTFGSKRELFESVARRYAQASEADWNERFAGAATPLAGLRAFLEGWRRCPAEIQGRGCLMVNSINELAERDEAFREFAAAHLDRQRARLRSAFEAAVAAGELPPDHDAAAHAARWSTLVLGLATLAKLPDADAAMAPTVDAALAELDDLQRRARPS